ncbi:ABC transporter ATP-binding protein [Phytoactinopolyspora endophytica]|uniref:ABC transporter ATP-binding protein n=1 Tax=Phytoactinopolyspora endophytica TaxID=1642495 RepID=UPI00101BD849|nr:ABC transporter ATP-binding protein [Phytoactinopolyspora endophytica]
MTLQSPDLPVHAHPQGGRVLLRGWGWRYAGRKRWACRGVDLDIEPGERVLLVGASGAGKSTLLRGIAGLLDPDASAEHEGEVLIGGRPAAQARDQVGMLFQDPEASLVMSRSGDDVAFGLENAGVPREQIWPRVDAALQRVGFGYGRERGTSALSGGEQQRLALAGALVRRPSVLVLDEPTANLDPDGSRLVMDAVQRAAGGSEATLVMVEHRVDLAVELVDRVVVLETGAGVIEDGPPETVFGRRGAALTAAGVWVPARWAAPARAPGRHRGISVPPVPLDVEADPGASQAGKAAVPSNRRLTTDNDAAVPLTPAGYLLLRADGVSRAYPGMATSALQRTDLELHAGEATCITGPNGSGKSTLAMVLAGLVRPDTGGAYLADDGRPLHRWRAHRLCRRIGTVFQDPEHQFLAPTVGEELAIGPRRAGVDSSEAARRCRELLERLRLDRLAGANPYTLSGGEKRRLSVATALATAPDVLILDEPTFGQDARTWSELVRLCGRLRDDGASILAVTHDLEFAAVLADRRIAMHDGTISPATTSPAPRIDREGRNE